MIKTGICLVLWFQKELHEITIKQVHYPVCA